MESTQAWWLGCVFGVLPLLLWLLRSWNELKFVTPLTNPTGSAKLPPGNMGLPVIGELLTFLWYFKIVRRPDDFIKSKREKYGDGVGLYRTHLFGSPSIIGCSPAFNKYVFQSHDLFPLQWPSIELIGHNALAAATGKRHTRIRNFVSNAINKPDVLKKITKLLQPNIVASLQSWADRGQVKAMDEVKKRTKFYEYSMVLGNSQSVLQPFQPYKIIYVYMLVEVGRLSDSLKYCQALLKSLKTNRSPEVEAWKQLLSSLEDRIRAHQQVVSDAKASPRKTSLLKDRIMSNSPLKCQNTPGHFIKVPLKLQEWTDQSIWWDLLLTGIHDSGKEAIRCRNTAFPAVVDALHEATASENVILGKSWKL